MALSQLSKDIRRFARLHALSKKISAELDLLKDGFRELAGDKDAIFQYRDMEVPVTWKERRGWDTALLDQKLGKKADDYKKTSRYAEVSCRKKAEVAA